MKVFLAIMLSVLALMASALYAGASIREIQIAKDCLRLGAFEVRGKFYSCEHVVKNYVESEDFK